MSASGHQSLRRHSISTDRAEPNLSFPAASPIGHDSPEMRAQSVSRRPIATAFAATRVDGRTAPIGYGCIRDHHMRAQHKC